MLALKYREPWELDLAEVSELNAAGPRDVVVDISYCGICGTDLGIASGSYPIAVPGTTMGHEATGEVAEVGSAVTSVRVGDRVVVDPTPYCGECRMCRTQRTNHCTEKNGTESGVSYDGAFASRFRTTEPFVHHVPDHVSLRAAALTEPLSCVLTGVAKIQPPTVTAYTYVFGAGPLGLLYTWALSLRGLRPAVVETSPARLEYASQALPPGTVAYPDLRQARTRHFGAADTPLDVVVDTTSGLLEDLYPMLAPGGTFMSVGLKEKTMSLNAMHLADRSLSVIGSIDSLRGSFVEALHLIGSGQIPAERLVSHVVPLAEYERAFSLLGCDLEERRHGSTDAESCKVLIQP